MITFRSLRSGSSGNMLLLEAGRTRLLIDCGISSQRACRQILEQEVGLTDPITGILVTHAHSDHINYAALRVLDQLRIPVYLHEATYREVLHRYLNPYRVPPSVDLSGLELRAFGPASFRIDGLAIRPIPVPHAPGVTTHAFAIEHGRRKLLCASDFNDPEAVIPHIYDCDLIYLESNHDLELLRLHYNPASLYHLANPAAGLLLEHAIGRSRRAPAAVVLGHLSDDRNRPELARETVIKALGDADGGKLPRLVTAPRHAATDPIMLEP